MQVTDRFLKYISVDTTSDPHSGMHPSTPSQLTFAAAVTEEMKELGLQDVSCDEKGYIFGTIPSTIPDYDGMILGFIAHMDTAKDASGANIRPRIIRNYDGRDIVLNEEKQIVLDTASFANLAQYKGQDLIVTDGLTLLGGDDKAGMAEILTAAEYLIAHPEIPHGPIRVGFTPDEEIGEGADFFDVKAFGADFAYTMDGGELGELEYENFNAAGAKVTFHGVSIHTGSAKNKLVNAATLAMEYQALLPQQQKPEFTEGYEGFFHLDSIHGGVEETVCEYLIRDHDRELFEAKKAVMKQAADFLNTRYGEGTVELEIRDSYFNMIQKIQPHQHLIDNVLDVYRSLDITPKIQAIRGGTDGARLSFEGLPCPNLGTGDHNCHGRYEFVCIQSMEKSVEVIVELARKYAVQK